MSSESMEYNLHYFYDMEWVDPIASNNDSQYQKEKLIMETEDMDSLQVIIPDMHIANAKVLLLHYGNIIQFTSVFGGKLGLWAHFPS